MQEAGQMRPGPVVQETGRQDVDAEIMSAILRIWRGVSEGLMR